ncbi:MAG: hypothetical protein JO144_13525 [Actinobacteria bacterium]|nr:hypothetical protein [Actinomycetota bacterium]
MVLTPLEVSGAVGVVASGLAFSAAMLSLRQKAAHDRRDAWWKRAQWAMDHGLSEGPDTRFVGTEAMRLLLREPTTSGTDAKVLRAAFAYLLDKR